jgi:hypothetical protein
MSGIDFSPDKTHFMAENKGLDQASKPSRHFVEAKIGADNVNNGKAIYPSFNQI